MKMMRRRFPAVWILCPVAILSAQQDKQGCKDYPLFTRMANYYLHDCKEVEFDQVKFTIAPSKTVPVEGRYYYVEYRLREGSPKPSYLQTVRNFQNAIRQIGGQVLHQESDHTTTLKLSRAGKETWAEVVCFWYGGGYRITVIEKQEMRQEVTAKAADWQASIQNSGHAAVYGIHFDTDKAEVKPESEPAINEIATLLKQNPSLSIYVAGHTDSTGEYLHNLRLSEARAKAVVSVLVSKHGIAASRLIACGVGPVAPAAANDTEEGRAQNRRVELVKR